MKRTLIVVAALLSLSVSAALAAPPADKGKPASPGQSAAAPGQSADKNAAKKCKAERGKTGVHAFKERTARTPTRRTPSASACRRMVKKARRRGRGRAEDEQAEKNAAKKCQAERDKLGVQPFKDTYGTNANKANAFGKCVSKLAKANGSRREPLHRSATGRRHRLRR